MLCALQRPAVIRDGVVRLRHRCGDPPARGRRSSRAARTVLRGSGRTAACGSLLGKSQGVRSRVSRVSPIGPPRRQPAPPQGTKCYPLRGCPNETLCVCFTRKRSASTDLAKRRIEARRSLSRNLSSSFRGAIGGCSISCPAEKMLPYLAERIGDTRLSLFSATRRLCVRLPQAAVRQKLR